MRLDSATSLLFFFFNDPAPTEIYPLSLHDALLISQSPAKAESHLAEALTRCRRINMIDHRLEEHTSNSSHLVISYAVFCLKKKKKDSRSNSWHLPASRRHSRRGVRAAS